MMIKKKYSFLFKREKHQKYKTGVPNLVLFLEKYGRRLKTTLTLEFFWKKYFTIRIILWSMVCRYGDHLTFSFFIGQ